MNFTQTVKRRFINFLGEYFNLFEIRERRVLKSLTYSINESKSFAQSKYCVGIVVEKWGLHENYIRACEELQVSYQVISFFDSDWMEKLEGSEFDFLLVRPSVQYAPWKEMFDMRINLIKDDIKVYPTALSMWIWESKIKTYEWCKYNQVPHPKTLVFYSRNEAIRYSQICNYPLVYKSNIGSGSSGVKIIRNRVQFLRQVRKCFNYGVRTYRKHKLDKEHGYIVIQDFVENVKEWRVIRTGRYYFAFEKLKIGDFHSGSKKFGYGMPPRRILDLVKSVTDQHNFNFVSIDVFIDQEKKVYINEIQPYFGQESDRELLRVDGKTGRLFCVNNEWHFEEGMFCKNNLANLRITEIIKELEG